MPPILKMTMVQVQLVEERKELDLEIRKLMAERDAIDEKIRFAMQSGDSLIGMHRSKMLVEMKPWSRTGIDVTRLRREAPQIAAKYMKTSQGHSLYYP